VAFPVDPRYLESQDSILGSPGKDIIEARDGDLLAGGIDQTGEETWERK